MFIYNGANFLTNGQHKLFSDNLFPSFSLSPSSTTLSRPSWFPINTNSQLIYGLNGFEFRGSSSIGFSCQIDFASTSSLTMRVTGLLPTTFGFGLDISALLITQMQCPVGYPYIDIFHIDCYDICPAGTLPATTTFGLTTLK